MSSTVTTASRPVRLLGDPGFRWLFSAQAASQLGDRVTEVAFPLVGVLVLHATTTQVSLLTAMVWLPQLVSPFVGAWMDRQPVKVRWMLLADLSRAAVLLSVPVAFAMHELTLAQMYVVAALTGLGTVLFNAGYPAFFVRLVDRRDFLAANSLLSGSRSVSYVVGPAAGGGLVQLLTAPWAVLADAVSFLVSAACLLRVRSRDVPREAADAAGQEPGHEPVAEAVAEAVGLWRQAGEGLAYMLRDPVLRATLGCATTANFFSLLFVALIVLFASRELDLRSGLIGLALGGGAVGGVVGAALVPRVSRRLGVGRTVVVGGLVFPAAMGIAAMAHGPTGARAGMLALSEFVGGIGVMAFDINLNALYASVIPDALRSRIGGAFAAVNYGARPLGALTGGLLAGWVGLRPTLWVAAVGGMLCVLWLLPSPIPGIRTLDDVADPG